MHQTHTVKEKLKQFMLIFYPIFITQVGLFAMNFFDILMSGNVSPADLAGVAIGSSIWLPIFTGLSGILWAVTPIVAQLIGAKRQQLVQFTVTQGIYLAIALALAIVALGFLILQPILNLMHLEDNVRHIALHYLIGLAFGIIPLFIYTVLRCYIDALGYTRITMFIILASLPLNIIFNYALIFGNFGLPALGGIGAGYATALTYWIITGLAIWHVLKQPLLAQYQVFRAYPAPSVKEWKEIIWIGVPIGFAIFFETSIFAAVTLFMSEYDTVTIASHKAALNFASLLYMFPLSVAMAMTILVGFEVGAKRFKDAYMYSKIGIAVAFSLSLIFAILLYVFREPIAGLYTQDPQVLVMAQSFLFYAIFFQISDAIATPIQGALRGYKDVKITFYLALLSYWVVGLPLGYLLAQLTPLGPYGYWIGLISGLASGAVLLYLRLIHIQKKLPA